MTRDGLPELAWARGGHSSCVRVLMGAAGSREKGGSGLWGCMGTCVFKHRELWGHLYDCDFGWNTSRWSLWIEMNLGCCPRVQMQEVTVI